MVLIITFHKPKKKEYRLSLKSKKTEKEIGKKKKKVFTMTEPNAEINSAVNGRFREYTCYQN